MWTTKSTRLCNKSQYSPNTRKFSSDVLVTPLFAFTAFTLQGQNLTEKITQQFLSDSHLEKVFSGYYVTVAPKHVMTHDNTAAVLSKFKKFFNDKRGPKIFNPRQPVFAIDHNIQDKSDQNLKQYRSIESFAKQFGIDFYPPGRGIGHQVYPISLGLLCR
jgi:homoaconitate hydratase